MRLGDESGQFRPRNVDEPQPLFPLTADIGGGERSPPPPFSSTHWETGVSGDWDNAADWSAGSVPTSSNNVTISVTGAYTVTIDGGFDAAAHSVLLNNASATLFDNGGELSITTTLTVTAGTLNLGYLSIVNGGTLSVGSAGILEATSGYGTLYGVTCQGVINLAASSQLDLNGTTTFVGAGGTGAGTITVSNYSDLMISGSLAGTSTINLTGDASNLDIAHSLVLSSGTLNIGTDDGATAGLSCYDPSGSPLTLTIGSGYTINHVGDSTIQIAFSATEAQTFINQGSIIAEAASGTFDLGNGAGTTIINQGAVTVGGGDLLAIEGASFSNSGLVSVNGAGAVLTIAGNLSNTGTIEANGGFIGLSGTLTTAVVDTITNDGGTIGMVSGGTLSNSGATLYVGQGTTLGVFSLGGVAGAGGTIAGGTVAESDSSFLFQNGTLSGVNFWGVVSLAGSYETLTLTGATTFAGTGGVGSDTISLTGSSTSLIFSGTALTGVSTVYETGDASNLIFETSQTFNNFTLDIGASDGSADSIIVANYTSSGVTTTLGPQLVINQLGNGAVNFSFQDHDGPVLDELINEGTIIAGVSNGQFHLGASSTTGSILNEGTIQVSGNDSLYVASADFKNTGTISVSSGGTVDLTQVGTFANVVSGTLTGGLYSVGQAGTLELANNVVVSTDSSSITLSSYGSEIQSYNSSTGTQVAIDATLQAISSNATLALLNGRNFDATANSGTFTNAGTLVLGGATFSATLLTMNSGVISGTGTIASLVRFNGSDSIVGGTVTLASNVPGAGTLSVAAGAGVIFGSGGSFSGTILDSGTVQLACPTFSPSQLTISAGGILSGQGTWGGVVTDYGLIDASSGTLAVAGLTQSSGGTWSGGGLEADTGALLKLPTNGSISADAGTITLSGSGSEIAWVNSGTGSLVSLDSTLSSILAGGTLSLLNGRSFTSVANAGSFSCAGVLALGGATFTASQLTLLNGGEVSGSGALAGGTSVAGTASAEGGVLSIVGSISGNGTLVIGASETVALSSATSGVFSGLFSDGGSLSLSGATLGSASITVSNGASLSGFGTLGGLLTNTGLVEATGGTLSVLGLVGTNGTLTGTGQFEVTAGSVLQIAANQSISTIADSVTLSGASMIQSLNTGSQTEVSLDSTLDAILNTGTLSLLNGRSFSAAANGGVFADAGLLSVNGGTFSATTLTVSSTGTFIDNGTFTGALNSTGSVQVSTGETLTLTSATNLGGSFTGGGIITLGGGGTYTVSPSTTLYVDTVQLAAGTTLSGSGTIGCALEGAGTLTAQGGTLVLDGSLRGSYGLVAAAGSVLDLADGSSYFGSISGGGNVVNLDQVSGASYAVSLTASSTLSVSNMAGGDLYAGTGTGVILVGTVNDVNNAGSIFGSLSGLRVSGTSNSIINSGYIIGDTGAAIVASDTSSTTIINSGTIANYEGTGVAVSLNGSASATLTNSGTIIGGYYLSNGGTAVQFGSGNDRLILDPGSVLAGVVAGGSGQNTIELASGTGAAGTISGLGTNFTQFGTVQVDSSANWMLTGSNALASNGTLSLASGASTTVIGTLTDAGGSITNAGSLTVAAGGIVSGTGAVSGSIVDQGIVEATGGTFTITGGLSGIGVAEIGSGSTLIENAGVTTSTLSFLSGTGTLELSQPASFASIIAGFDTTDTIDLLNTVVTGDSFVNNTLTLTGASGTIGTFLFTGNYTGDTFSFGSDGHGGTNIHLV
jgi:fibronectin-binding autotransporter adhesin